MRWSIVVAANSEDVLASNILRSKTVCTAQKVIVKRNAHNASSAYNGGLYESNGDVVVFAHQDVYLPINWSERLAKYLSQLNALDENWGVAGVFGVTSSGIGAGYIYSTGLRSFIGNHFTNPTQVVTLDEMLLIVRKAANLWFDEKLPGFHLYGTDICLKAEARGMRNYVLPCFALHNSIGTKWLPLSFWMAYMYMRKKWWHRLPVVTPCTKITKGCTPILKHILSTTWSTIRGRNKPGSRVKDPEEFYIEHLSTTEKIELF